MEQNGLSDSRRSAHGLARVLIIAVAVLAVVVTWLAIIGATTAFRDGHPLIASCSLLAALMWGWMAAGLIHNGRKMRRVALGTAIANLVASVGGLVLDLPADRWNPWLDGGVHYFFLPPLLCVVVLWWLWHSSPARLARRNG